MGWTVLYIAFGVVALWLLGEVLLQYKARLRWRALAFAGFLGVVVGTVLPSVIVIGVGIAAFAVGQTFVTLSVRSGFTAGWSLGGGPGSSRRRRAGTVTGRDTASLEVTGLETHGPGAAPAPGTMPVPDPVDDYGPQGYGGQEPAPPYGQEAGTDYAYAGYGAYSGPDGYEEETSVFGGHPGAMPPSAPVPGPVPAAEETQVYAYGEAAGSGEQYADPYAGYPEAPGAGDSAAYQNHPAYQEYPDPYGGYGGGYADEYAYPAPPQEPAQQQPYYPDVPETPPGGVWVPQQRDSGAPLPPAEPPPYGGYGSEYGNEYGGSEYGDYYGTDTSHQQPQPQPQPYPQQAPQYPPDYYGSGQY
ncbi:hypothetical protein [Streptomyces spirodelae]|uniref:hypothetical protein n=1 Tax=Streptomyces spirodelae TaxID=2812904 RepID=UPI001E34E158|nr:hypothetical protein [Streptomyces spirodelae]